MSDEILRKDPVSGPEMQQLKLIGIQLHQQRGAEISQMKRFQIQYRTGAAVTELILQEKPFLGNTPAQGWGQIQQKPGNPPVIPECPVIVLHLDGNLCRIGFTPLIKAA